MKTFEPKTQKLSAHLKQAASNSVTSFSFLTKYPTSNGVRRWTEQTVTVR